jgi:hypothetical protein
MTRDADKAVQALADLREKIREKFSIDEIDILYQTLSQGPLSVHPLYASLRCVQDKEYLERLLKKKRLNQLEILDLFFHLIATEAMLSIFEGSACFWTDGAELLQLTGQRIQEWIQDGGGWPFSDFFPSPYGRKDDTP